MKKSIIYLSILFISLANNVFAYYDDTTYRLDKYNTSVKQNDYYQESYNKKRLINPYVGLDLFYTEFSFSKKTGEALDRPGTYFKDSSLGVAGVVGFRFHKYLGLEGFYKHTFGENKITPVAVNNEESSSSEIVTYNINGSTVLNSFGVDLLAYLPLDKQIDFLASVGIGQYEIKTTLKQQIEIATLYNNNITSKKYDTSAVRIGAGLQYNIKESVYMRGMAHYVKLSDDKYIKSLIEVSLGLYYMF